MAECHPVGFQWVMEAKARGASVIHIDPRYTRTSAVADLHVPLRAGSDIVLLGGLINYVLSSGRFFREYVVNYTNAATIVSEDFQDTEDLDGLFSGFDPEQHSYDQGSWTYEGAEVQASSGERDKQNDDQAGSPSSSVSAAGRGEAHGSGGAHVPQPKTDPTLQHPRCVFQILKRHYARYTADMVERACGIAQPDFLRVCELITANSGRDRTTAWVYSVGWTQHTVGVQYIRGASVLQALLGNIGRPGGGILALRGHASIQGSTDIPTLFDLLPGYIPMPHAHTNENLDAFIAAEGTDKGFWANMSAYTISLLKAWWGTNATGENDFCFDYLPRLTGSHSTYETVMAQLAGDCKGYLLLGENPAVGSANGKLQRLGLAKLDWLVVRDFSLIESATFWKDGPEIDTGELTTEDIGTEVFFLPAAAHTEKDGSFTNTQRMLQWHHAAVEPAGDARSELWFTYHLGRLIRQKLAASADEMDRPVLDLTWAYPLEGEQDEPSAEAVLAEINGWDGDGKPLSAYTELKDDGSTACGCWIYAGVYADGVNQADRRKPGQEQNWIAAEWGWAWPAQPADPVQPRLCRPRRQAVERAQGPRLVGRRAAHVDRARRPRLRARQGARLPAARRRDRSRGAGGDRPVHHAGRRQGMALRASRPSRRSAARPLRAAGLPGAQPAIRPAAKPGQTGQAVQAPGQPLPAERGFARLRGIPVRGHHLPADRAPYRGRDEPLAALPFGAAAGVLLRGVPRARSRARARASWLGHDRHRAQRGGGQGTRHLPDPAADH